MRGLIAALLAVTMAGEAVAGGCYARTYSDAHLRKNPNQTVREIAIQFRDEADGIAEVKVVFRDSDRAYRETLYCWDPDRPEYGDAYLGCSVECDGGYFLARPRDARSILIETRGGFLVSGGCGDEGAMRRVEDRGAAKTIFRLDEAVGLACK